MISTASSLLARKPQGDAVDRLKHGLISERMRSKFDPGVLIHEGQRRGLTPTQVAAARTAFRVGTESEHRTRVRLVSQGPPVPSRTLRSCSRHFVVYAGAGGDRRPEIRSRKSKRYAVNIKRKPRGTVQIVDLNRRFHEWNHEEPPDPDMLQTLGLDHDDVGREQLLSKRRVVILAEAGST
jgi:hypothetical protein